MNALLKQFRNALVLLLVMAVITGIVYPLLVTGISQLFFNRQANGSFIMQNGRNIGSDLIGQNFDDPKYFWGRLSATSPEPYNAASSSGSNLGPSNPVLLENVQKRIDALKAADPGNDNPVPVDLVTFSGSGLDPDISIAAAVYQAPRIARVRGLTADTVKSLIDEYTEGRQLGVLGEPRVNVLRLNMALDGIR
jgi:potassium-transporting ATPase KdpC subunit